jgi:hypothetical protein
MMRALAPEGILPLGAQQLGGAENEDGEQGKINSNQHFVTPFGPTSGRGRQSSL